MSPDGVRDAAVGWRRWKPLGVCSHPQRGKTCCAQLTPPPTFGTLQPFGKTSENDHQQIQTSYWNTKPKVLEQRSRWSRLKFKYPSASTPTPRTSAHCHNSTTVKKTLLAFSLAWSVGGFETLQLGSTVWLIGRRQTGPA